MPRSRRPELHVRSPERAAQEDEMARALTHKIAQRGEAIAGGVLKSKHHDVITPGMRGLPRVRKRDDVAMRTTTLHLPVPLFQRMMRYSAEHDVAMSQTVAEALTHFLDDQEAPK